MLTPEQRLALLETIAENAELYVASTGEHYWRCEYRTAAKGWKPGRPPVIECECGLDKLDAALVELRNDLKGEA